MRRSPRLLLLWVSLLFVGLAGLRAAPVQGVHTTVELLSSTDSLVPGETTDLAVHFEIDPHWHLYWVNPGSSGFPPEFDWTLPSGYEVGEIRWPAPEHIELAGLVTYGYEDVLTLVLPLSVPKEAVIGEPVTIGATVDYLICKDVCLPGGVELELELPVVAQGAAPANKDRFDTAAASMPKTEPPFALSGSAQDGILRIEIEGDAEVLPQDAYFFATAEQVTDPNAPQSFSFTGERRAELRVTLDGQFDASVVSRIQGVLQTEGEAGAAWEADIPLGASAVGDELSAPSVQGVGGFEGALLQLGLPGWLALAFFGGLILNIMPCVLPVLSLKVFSLLKHSGQTRGQAVAHGLAYTLGVVASFLFLAGALFVLRAAGEQIGWGFQLQSPGFVIGLSLLFFLFGLNLLGVYELGSGLVGADAHISQRRDLSGSLGMGVLAAVVGAPCMGPMVASVSGVAIQASVAEGLLIFGVMGLGLASPFLFLAIFPALVRFLPKPGAWMESFKQAMGFLLMAAVVFLVWVYGQQTNLDAVMTLLVAILLAAIAAWIYGRWSAPNRKPRTRWIGRVIALAFFAYGASVAFGYEEKKGWEPWSDSRVESEIANGNAVFVDFTATWCLICQANKAAMRSEETTELFTERGVVSLEADWTLRDPVIAAKLESFGRAGVPLYLLYAPDGSVEVLPQNLTNQTIRDAVAAALD